MRVSRLSCQFCLHFKHIESLKSFTGAGLAASFELHALHMNECKSAEVISPEGVIIGMSTFVRPASGFDCSWKSKWCRNEWVVSLHCIEQQFKVASRCLPVASNKASATGADSTGAGSGPHQLSLERSSTSMLFASASAAWLSLLKATFFGALGSVLGSFLLFSMSFAKHAILPCVVAVSYTHLTLPTIYSV